MKTDKKSPEIRREKEAMKTKIAMEDCESERKEKDEWKRKSWPTHP